MRRLTSLLLSCSLLLAGCGSTATAQYQVSFVKAEGNRVEVLKQAMIRVVDARLQSRKKALKDHSLEEVNGKNVLTVTVTDAQAAAGLQEQLTTPFEIRIMTEVAAGQGDIHSDKYGDFKETGIVEKHFDWVEVNESPTPDKGKVTIHFTEEGKKLIKDIFTNNQGKVIAIFVRGQLMSKKMIGPKDTQDSISIDNIPTPQIAEIFADDVNVGLHVTFAPVL